MGEPRKDIQGAETELRRAIEIDPDYVDALCFLGTLLGEHKKDVHGAEFREVFVLEEQKFYGGTFSSREGAPGDQCL